MKTNPDKDPKSKPRDGLSYLAEVILDDCHKELFEKAKATCRGGAVWRQRKLSEIHDFLALSQLSGRINTMFLNLSGPLRILFEMKVTVPTLPDPAGELIVADRAHLGLTYREEAIRLPQPGYSFIEALQPNHIWLANAAPSDPAFPRFGPGQAICLGATIEAGTPVKELILMSFGALTLQSVQLDALDAAGVMNDVSARWWMQNRDRIPLTREAFIETESKEK